MHKDPILARFNDGRLVFRVEGGLHYIRGNSSPHFALTASGYDHGSEFGGCGHETILEHFPQFADLAALHLSDIDGAPIYAEANGWYWLAGVLGGAGQEYHGSNAANYKRPSVMRRAHWCRAGCGHHFDSEGNDSTPIPACPKCGSVPSYTGRAERKCAKNTREDCLQFFADYCRITIEEAETIAADVASKWNYPDMRKRWGELCEAMRPRWKQEADACIKKHGLVVFGDVWTPTKEKIA